MPAASAGSTYEWLQLHCSTSRRQGFPPPSMWLCHQCASRQHIAASAAADVTAGRRRGLCLSPRCRCSHCWPEAQQQLHKAAGAEVCCPRRQQAAAGPTQLRICAITAAAATPAPLLATPALLTSCAASDNLSGHRGANVKPSSCVLLSALQTPPTFGSRSCCAERRALEVCGRRRCPPTAGSTTPDSGSQVLRPCTVSALPSSTPPDHEMTVRGLKSSDPASTATTGPKHPPALT